MAALTMKALTSVLLLPLVISSLGGLDSSAQPWSQIASNSAPKAGLAPGITVWTEAPTTATPIVPPQHSVHPTQTPIFSNQPLPAGILAFDADQKEYTLKPGEVNSPFVFNVTNISSGDVTITYVQTSCGCTTTRLQLPMKLEANQAGEIPINMNVAGKSG